jgi:hypothetical protein
MAKSRLARVHAQAARWEWRAFWSSAATAPSIEEVLEKPARSEYSRLTDRYLVIDTRLDNFKIRNDSLQVKQLIEQYDRFEAYRHKQSFPFPIVGRELLPVLPRLREPDRVFSSMPELNAALYRYGYQPMCYDVRKERYKRTVRGVAIEFVKLELERRRFWSVGVAGAELERVESVVAKLPNHCTMLGGYTQFLAQLAEIAEAA